MRHVTPTPTNVSDRTSPRRAAALLAVAGAALVLGGCEADSFMDPSVTGRWEYTPTVVPVLERIASVEQDDADFVQTSDVTPEDLVPVAVEGRINAGDQLDITIRDFFRIGEEAPFQRQVDRRGQVEIPRLPLVRVQGMSPQRAAEAIAEAVRAEGLLQEPVVSVVPRSQREQTFSAFGAVTTPGNYYIPSPDFRLLEALTTAGGFNQNVPKVYVIRQVPLTESDVNPPPAPASDGQQGAARSPAQPNGQPGQRDPNKLIDLIDELSQPKTNTGAAPQPTPRPSPTAWGTAQPGGSGGSPTPPPIDLPDNAPAAQPGNAPGAGQGNGAGRFNWIYVNGQWVRSGAPQGGPAGAPATTPGTTGESVATQRVIEVPTTPLISGAAKYNIVIRPGDIIRVPALDSGIVYVTGQVARPGSYNIPASGRITLQRVLDSAGGLSSIAIPERVDLTRMIGTNRQATIRLNLRAIAEQTQPDIFLKPDDRINVGTNFWALPLAVVRGGFRASYGFGFILDRNFGNDVFGAPPESRFGG